MSSSIYITNNFNPNTLLASYAKHDCNTTSDPYLQRMMNRCNQNVIDTQSYLSSKPKSYNSYNQSSTYLGNNTISSGTCMIHAGNGYQQSRVGSVIG
jgi:hypothetical protein